MSDPGEQMCVINPRGSQLLDETDLQTSMTGPLLQRGTEDHGTPCVCPHSEQYGSGVPGPAQGWASPLPPFVPLGEQTEKAHCKLLLCKGGDLGAPASEGVWDFPKKTFKN